MAELNFDNWAVSQRSGLQQPYTPSTIDLTASMTSSMPELAASLPGPGTLSDLPTPDVSEQANGPPTEPPPPPPKDKKPVKGVRFEGIQDTLPRSRSYSGRTSDPAKRSSRRNRRKSCSERHRSNDGASTSRSAARRQHDDDDSDASSVCSTCSSSSSSADDHVYQLPQRRHYGGVRVSYVPNDAIACARKRKQETDGEKDNKNCIIS